MHPSNARRGQPSAPPAAYAQFRSAIKLEVDEQAIKDIVKHEGVPAVRAAVDAADEVKLKRMLASHATRQTLLRLKLNSLKPAQVASAIKSVGWPTYAQALSDPGATAKLHQWMTAALVAHDAAADAATPASAANPSRRAEQSAAAPPPARLPPPDQVDRGPKPAATNRRPPPAGAANATDIPPDARRDARTPSRESPSSAAQAAADAAAAYDAANAGFDGQFEPPSSPEQGRTTSTANGGKEYLPNEHVYNKGKCPKTNSIVARAALCVEAVNDKSNNPVIKLEGAGPHPTDPDRYNWTDKTIFYATPDELPKLLCVMLGYLEEASFNNHGPNNNKYLKLKRQEDSLYCSMGEGSEKSVAIKIPAANAARIAVITMLQYQRASHGLDASVLHMVLAKVTAPLVRGEESKRGQRRH